MRKCRTKLVHNLCPYRGFAGRTIVDVNTRGSSKEITYDL